MIYDRAAASPKGRFEGGGCGAEGNRELAVVREMGFGKTFGGLWRRRLFVLGLLLCAAGAFVVPKFVFFYDVVGNETVPDAEILRALHSLGVGFRNVWTRYPAAGA
ncbi:MAG: sporulation protein YqfD [Oscillospiraceae bacterium]